MRFAPLLAVVLFPLLSMSVHASNEISFKEQIQPILNDYCVSCHKPGGKGYEKTKLDLRTYQSLIKGTQYGSIIQPGDSFTSILIQVIEGRVHASLKMPYGLSGGLSKTNINLMKGWVQQGAKDN